MKMSKHTPGPWTSEHGKIVGNGYNIASINSSATTEGKANALIMAAALDMFKALQKFNEYENAMDVNDDVAGMLAYAEFSRMAHISIAKATGQ